MRSANKSLLLRIGAIGMAVCPASSLFAQQQPVLEEIIVTAQKRQERIQDVPLSITAISGAQLDARGIDGVEDLNALAPNMVFKTNPTSNLASTISLRGSSTSQPAIWMDPLVGLYVDGVYMGKTQGSVFDVIDMERVEILRGPQGTLFGRNTEGGAVNIVTRKPSGVWSGSVRLDLGNLGHSVGRVALDLPRLGIASISVGYRKEDQDGWAKNSTGPDMGKKDSEVYRVAAQFDFSDDFVVNYTYDHSEANDTPPPSSLYADDGSLGPYGPSMIYGFIQSGVPPSIATAMITPIATAMAAAVTTSRPDTVSTNTPDGLPIFQKATHYGHALNLSYDLNDRNALKYIFATRKMTYDDAQDITGMNMPGANFYYDTQTRYKQDSHELQWIGTANRMHYVVGYYHFEDDGTTNDPQDSSVFFGDPVLVNYSSTTKSDALYGQVDYALTDKWTATVGFRRTEEKKGGSSHQYLTDGFNGPFLADTLPMTTYSAKFTGNTPMAALAYRYDDTTNIYARVAKGFKSGGFSSEAQTIAGVSTPFEPQTSISTEVGIKKSFAGNRAQINAAVFQSKIEDQQLSLLIPGTSSSWVKNAGKSTYQGVELEGSFMPVDGWRIQFGYGYLDAEFDEYMDQAANIPGNPLINTAGNRLPNSAPEHTFNLYLDGRLAQTRYGALRALVDYSYTASMYLYAVQKDLAAADAGLSGSLASKNLMPAFSNLNARLLLSSVPMIGPGTADISLWARNLTDGDKQIQGIDFGLFRTANWQEPRTYGISMNYKW